VPDQFWMRRAEVGRGLRAGGDQPLLWWALACVAEGGSAKGRTGTLYARSIGRRKRIEDEWQNEIHLLYSAGGEWEFLRRCYSKSVKVSSAPRLGIAFLRMPSNGTLPSAGLSRIMTPT